MTDLYTRSLEGRIRRLLKENERLEEMNRMLIGHHGLTPEIVDVLRQESALARKAGRGRASDLLSITAEALRP